MNTIIAKIVADLVSVDAKTAFDGSIAEQFSCVVANEFLIDVIEIDNLPNVECVIDVWQKPHSHNIHCDFTQTDDKVHIGCFACGSLADAVQRIFTAVQPTLEPRL